MKDRFFSGSKTDDARFKARHREAIASLDYPSIFSTPLSAKAVDREGVSRWISNEIARILDIEDEVLSEMIVNMLFVEGPKASKAVDPRELQLTLGGFVGKRAAYTFMNSLWTLLVDGKTFARTSLNDSKEKRRPVEREAAKDDQRSVQPSEPLSPTSSREKHEQRHHREHRYSDRRHPQRYQDRRRSRSRGPTERRRSRSRSRSRQRDSSRSYFEDRRASERRSHYHSRRNDHRSDRSSRSPQRRSNRYPGDQNQRRRSARSSKSRSPASTASTYASPLSNRSSSLSVAAAEPSQNPCSASASQWDEAQERAPQAPAISLSVDVAVERMLRERALKSSTQSHRVCQ